MRTHVLKRHLLLSLVAVTSFVGLFGLQLGRASDADAAVVGFCGNVLLRPVSVGSSAFCQTGYISNVYEVYGWGEHSVCVELQPWTATHCSTGTNGVYSGEPPAGDDFGWPTIKNHTETNNYASALYFTR